MNSRLSLLRMTPQDTPVSAGWLSSMDPIEWLGEVAHNRRHGCILQIYPVATSTQDLRAVGVFLLPAKGTPSFRARVIPLRQAMPSVHLPQDATLSIGLQINEQDFLFRYDVHFFHPTFGLIGFAAKDELPAHKLIALPQAVDSRWNLAVPAENFSPALKALHLTTPLDPEAMLADAGMHIGDQKGTKPKTSTGLADMAARIGLGLAGGALLGGATIFGGLWKIANLTSNLTGKHKAGKGFDADALREWATKNWRKLADQRTKEIERLMKLMETDPDLGLRYALPLAGGLESRGKSLPTGRLFDRGNQLTYQSSTGAADSWNMEQETRLRLERQYREAAQREIARGNPGRAAYIYGNLLNDWYSAARALMEAGRHADASAIYLHKLNNRAAAAKCLVDGGQFLQAAQLYVEARQFEKAGDIHAKLGNIQQARELWGEEVEAQRGPLEKARILTQKLEDHQAALTLLEAEWQANRQAQDALPMMFDILRHHGELADSVSLMERMFSQESIPLITRLTIAHKESGTLNQAKFTISFTQHAYQKIGSHLSAKKTEAATLLSFLPKLEPADRLLQRDATRYLTHKAPPQVADSSLKRLLKQASSVALPRDVKWHSISCLPQGVSMAGYGKDMLAVAQYRNGNCMSSALKTQDDPGKSFIHHLVVTSSRGSSRLFHFRDHQKIHYRALDRARTGHDDELGYLTDVLAIGPYGDEGDFAILHYTNTSSLSASIYSEAATLRRTLPLDIAPAEVAQMNWRICGKDDHLWLGAEGFIAWRNPEGLFSTMNLGQQRPESIHLSPSSPLSVLVSLDHEVLQITATRHGKPLEPVNLCSRPDDSHPPQSIYLPNGRIIIAHGEGGEIYLPGNLLEPEINFRLPAGSGAPIGLCPWSSQGFALLTSSEQLVVFGK